MNDLTILHDAWEAPEPPSPASYARARAALRVRAARRRPRPRMRLAAVGALALAIAAAPVVAQNLGTGGSALPGGAVPIASAQVLERAAKAAEQAPFVAPRANQWIYLQDRFTGNDGRTQTQASWHRADGEGMAYLDEHGKLHVEDLPWPKGRPKPPLESYEGLASLPTDPAALLRWAYAQDMENGNTSKDGVVFLMFNHVLRGNILPPDLEAAIFRALKQLPGVTLQTVDIFGKPAYSLAFTDDWLREELLIDPQTYAYRGERSTVVKTTKIDPQKAGNATGQVTKGSTVIAERLATAIVDEPGQRG
jgi:hypothetical protein